MKTQYFLPTLVMFVLAFSFAGNAYAQKEKKEGFAVGQKLPPEKRFPPPSGVKDLKWDDMIPSDWNPRRLLDQMGLSRLEDGDPRADEILARIRAEWDRAPVVDALNGQRVRLPGFVVMLDGGKRGVNEFLLVPYFGACIHVPPPPSNQLVHVFPAKPVPDKVAQWPVWVIGTLVTVQADTKMGNAGYRIKDAKVEEYPWKK